MPIYEYRCADCGFQNEYLQKVSEPPMTVCPSCGKESFRKLLSAAGFQLKGSGWYVTDFKNSGRASPGKTQAEGAKSEGTKSEGTKSEGTKSEGSGSAGESNSGSKSDSSSGTSNDKGAASARAAG